MKVDQYGTKETGRLLFWTEKDWPEGFVNLVKTSKDMTFVWKYCKEHNIAMCLLPPNVELLYKPTESSALKAARENLNKLLK